MAATKSRRTRAKKPVGETFEGNIVVARRLAFLSESEYAKAAKEFSEGASVSALCESYDFRTSARAAYGVRQKLVADGTVAPVEPTQKALAAAKDSGEHADIPWLCARSGLTPSRVKAILEGEE